MLLPVPTTQKSASRTSSEPREVRLLRRVLRLPRRVLRLPRRVLRLPRRMLRLPRRMLSRRCLLTTFSRL